MTWPSSSRPPPKLSRPPIDRLCGTVRGISAMPQ
jgi:hypothetical protein